MTKLIEFRPGVFARRDDAVATAGRTWWFSGEAWLCCGSAPFPDTPPWLQNYTPTANPNRMRKRPSASGWAGGMS
jgi:hypothetical protein